MKRSIHGMGQIMSTMVLSRQQSMFGVGQALAGLEGGLRTKDSIDKMDVTVMDTKLKILEILQVSSNRLTAQTNQRTLRLPSVISTLPPSSSSS